MPGEVKSESVTMTTVERTRLINVEIVADPMITAYREIVHTANEKVIGRENTGMSIRKASDSPEVAQMIADLIAATDAWVIEDATEGLAKSGLPRNGRA